MPSTTQPHRPDDARERPAQGRPRGASRPDASQGASADGSPAFRPVRSAGRGRIEAGGARGVLHDEASAGASQVSAARTRTMGSASASGVKAFRTRDYQAPEVGGDPGAQTRASAADVEGLGRAKGVSSLRAGHLSRSQEGRAQAAEMPLPRNRVIAIVVALALVAVAIGVGTFFLVRGALVSVNESAASSSSAHYATDAFDLVAVRGEDGALSGAYLTYVDSINGRTELCALPADLAATMPSGQEAGTLADVFSSGGVESLASVVQSMASVSFAASFEVTSAQMDAIIDVATNAGSTQDVASLASEICSGADQNVTEAALRGLLVTMRDVGSEGYVELTAPVDEVTTDDGTTVQQLRTDEWQTMVRGMRDAAGDVTLASA